MREGSSVRELRERGAYLINFSTSAIGECGNLAEIKLVANKNSIGIAAAEICKTGISVNLASSAIVDFNCGSKVELQLVNFLNAH